MKKIITVMAMLLAVLAISISSYSDYIRTSTIPSVRIRVNTSELSAGDTLSSNASSYISVPDNNYYDFANAYWLDDVTDLTVGDSPRLRVILDAVPREVEHNYYTDIYLFRGSYTSSNVYVSDGSFLSADTRDNGYALEVTIRIDPIKGVYNSPTSADWTSPLGMASWQVGSNDSGYYDLYLYRNGSIVKRLYAYHGRSYNFYPYMTREGDYHYRVRTVPDPADSIGRESDFLESSTLYIDQYHISDGTGQTDQDVNGGSSGSNVSSGTPVTSINGVSLGDSYGWITVGNSRYFRYPDQSLATGWLKLNGVYYRFNDDGSMMTGWYLNPWNQWYYMDPASGAMLTGWADIGGERYYLDPRDYESQGMMLTGVQTIGGQIYYFDSSGAMQTGWEKIGDAYYYFYPKDSVGGGYGYLATNTWIGYFYVGADGSWRAS